MKPAGTMSMVAACLLLGVVLALTNGLLLVVSGIALLGFAWYCVERPNAALCIAVFVLVVVPQYLVLYVPGLPALPPSLGPMLLLGGVLVLTALTAAQPLPRPRSPIVAAYFLFGLALVVATLVAGDKEGITLFVRAYLIPLLLFQLCLYFAGSTGSAMRVMNWLLVAACLVALFSIFEFSVKRNDLLEQLVINSEGDSSLKETMAQFYLGNDAFVEQPLIYRCFSVFGNPLEFGAFMSMIFPFALVHAIGSSDPNTRRRYIFAALVCALGVVMSFSRGPILAMVLSTLGMAVFMPQMRRAVAVFSIVAALAFAAAWPLIGERIESRLNEADNVTVRFKLWEVGARMFLDHPLVGVGLSNYDKHREPTIRAYRIGPFHEYGGNIDNIATVDNHLIQLAAETGAFGLITYIVLLMLFFRGLYRVWRAHPLPYARNSALAIAAGGFNYLFNGLTITSFVMFIITLIFTCFLAVGAALAEEVPA